MTEYQQRITEDLKWLRSQRRTREREHIIKVLTAALEAEEQIPPAAHVSRVENITCDERGLRIDLRFSEVDKAKVRELFEAVPNWQTSQER